MPALLTSVVALTIALIAGCNNAKTPDAIAADVAAAKQKATTEVATFEKEASNDIRKATDAVNEKATVLRDAAKAQAKSAEAAVKQ